MEALAAGQRLLRAAGVESARLECELLLCSVLKCERHHLYLMGSESLDTEKQKQFEALINRRLTGEPVQYILGRREFMGLEFYVDKSVLIPRFETEVMVEYVIDAIGRRKARILDLGTGSGAISVSLAVYLPDTHIVAVDISREALESAKKNANRHGVVGRIDFIESDMFERLEGDAFWFSFDAVVSNPPYIRSGDIKGLMREVRDFEPISALDGGADGLDFYREIAGKAFRFLKPGGLVAVEMGYDQSASVREIFRGTGKYDEGRILKDLSGIDRVAVFYKHDKE